MTHALKAPVCKVHGCVMVEHFDIKEIRPGFEIATPNGTYSCLKCDADAAKAERK